MSEGPAGDGTPAAEEPEVASPHAAAVSGAPRVWHGTPYAWRFGRYLTRRRLDLLLRARSAQVLPTAGRARFLAMRLPAEAVAATLGEVRSVADWPEAWTRTAQRFLGEARREGPAGNRTEAALARRRAAGRGGVPVPPPGAAVRC